jgi:3-hydroxyacyl-CoA dehydrogenase
VPAVSAATASDLWAGARERVAAGAPDTPAASRCIDAVAAAASLPFEEGVRFERALFDVLVRTTEARALRHAFLAERSAARIPDVPADTPTRPIRSAAVIGAGTMGAGIAMCFANAGIPVALLDVTSEALDKGMAVIGKSYERSAEKGKLTLREVGQRLASIHPALDYADPAVAGADIVVEAVFEDLAVKQRVWRRLDEAMKPGAILATNTSTLDVNAIAGFTRRPHDVVGTHFFSPAHVMKLLEIVRGAATGKDVLATVRTLGKTLNKTGVVAGVCDGFIGNRMLEQYLRQAWFLLEEGALPGQVDRVLEAWGMAMGPFRMSDLAGNDVGWYIRKRRYVEKPELVYARIADQLCAQGRFGQKTGAGWYRYEAGKREAIADPFVDDMVIEYSRSLGVTRRSIADDEIVGRCIFALVNEGARILEEGIAQRASDIDVVYLAGYGFPRLRGGPMHYADAVGLASVMQAMNRFAARDHGDPAFWRPAPLLTRLAAEGGILSPE